GKALVAGDVLLGLASSGFHSNGYSLVRRVFLEEAKLKLDAHLDGVDGTLGEALLRPTRIYVRALRKLAAAGWLKGAARITAVGVNVPGCGALAKAEQAGVATFVIDHKAFASREGFDAALIESLRQHDVELVVLAGFMRLLTAGFLAAFPHRVINIHPAL